MSFEAISNIAQAEAQAKTAVAEAESKARQMLADADTAGKLAVDAACAKAVEELKKLGRQVNEKAKAHAVSLSGDLENQKAALRARAESRLDAAAALVVERIVNS